MTVEQWILTLKLAGICAAIICIWAAQKAIRLSSALSAKKTKKLIRELQSGSPQQPMAPKRPTVQIPEPTQAAPQTDMPELILPEPAPPKKPKRQLVAITIPPEGEKLLQDIQSHIRTDNGWVCFPKEGK